MKKMGREMGKRMAPAERPSSPVSSTATSRAEGRCALASGPAITRPRNKSEGRPKSSSKG